MYLAVAEYSLSVDKFSYDSGGKLCVCQDGRVPACLKHVDGTVLHETAHLKVLLFHIPAAHSVLSASSEKDGKGNKSSFISQSGNFNVVFYGKQDVSLEADGDKFCLGKLYVEDESVFKEMALESGNYISAYTCTVNTSKWTFAARQNLSSATESANWSTNVESAFRGVATQSAFQSNSSQLTAEENQFVNALASVWINTLNTPLCEGFVESSSVQQELRFEINGKECVLKSKGVAFGFGGVNAVYLNVDGASYDSTVGIVSNANVKEFSEKAQKYLAENMKSELIGYASGGIAGVLQGTFGWGGILQRP